MSDPHHVDPTYGPPPAAAYQQPWGPPAPMPQAPVPPSGYSPPQTAYPAPGPMPQTAAYPAPGPFVAPYATPPAGVLAPPPPSTGGSALGIVALVVGVIALVAAPVVVAIAGYNIGLGVGREVALDPSSADFDWSILSPVRDWVLVAEVSFWAGTVLGVWALVQGIVAIVKKRGRGAGIAAIVVAVVAPIAFGVVVQGFVVAGIAAGSSLGG